MDPDWLLLWLWGTRGAADLAAFQYTSDVLFIEIEKSKDQMSILEAEKCPFYGFEMRFGPSNVDFSSDLVLR